MRLDTFATEPQLRAYVESLVSRAYAEIHETRAAVRQDSVERARGGLSAGLPASPGRVPAGRRH